MGILFFVKIIRRDSHTKVRKGTASWNIIQSMTISFGMKKMFGEVMGGKVRELESDKLIRQGMERERENTERERQNTEKALQRVKEAKEEIRYLKRLLAEQEMKKNLK